MGQHSVPGGFRGGSGRTSWMGMIAPGTDGAMGEPEVPADRPLRRRQASPPPQPLPGRLVVPPWLGFPVQCPICPYLFLGPICICGTPRGQVSPPRLRLPLTAACFRSALLFPHIFWQTLKRTGAFWLELCSQISALAKLMWLGTRGLNSHIRNVQQEYSC